MSRKVDDRGPRRAAGYIRVSALMGREGESFLSDKIQREKIEAWAAYRDYTITRWYIDLDVSGTGKVRRPEFERMMADARDHRFEAVAVYRLTRFARSTRGAAVALDELEQLGVGLVSVTEDIDTTTAGGKFMRNVLFAMAEFESERIGEEWRNTHAARRRRGIANVTRPVYGYRIEKGKILDVEDAEAAAIRLMFNLRLQQRLGYVGIRNELERQGYVTKQGHSRFSVPSIRKILRNPLYAGLVVDNSTGEIHEGQHEAIVSRDVWDAVQRTNEKASAWSNHRIALLSGLLVCSGCDYRMGYDSKTRNGFPMYVCNTNSKASRSCEHAVAVHAGYADDYISRLFLSRFSARRMPHDGRLRRTRQQAEWQRKAQRLRKRAEELTRALDSLADQRYVKGSLAAEEYDRQFARFSIERADVLAEAGELDEAAATVRPLDIDVLSLWKRAPEGGGPPLEVKQQALRNLIERIDVLPGRKGPGARARMPERLRVAWLQ